MPRQVVIEFKYGSDRQSLVHRVLNFNESLFAMARVDEWMSFPLDQIDKVTGQCVSVKSARRLRRVQTKIEQLLDKHRLLKFARLSVVNQKP
jgi:hypothetical protein